MCDILKTLMTEVEPALETSGGKVSIVGAGQVGMACAFSLLTQHICSELALVDMAEDKLKGELMDLQHGLTFLKNVKIQAGTDYAVTAGSRVVVVTAGARQREGESRLSLVQRNCDIFKGIIPQIVKNSPNAILLIVSNPVDVLTYVAWRLSGLPKNRVIGSGTNLDSSRFRFHLSQKLNVAPSSAHGWIIGEHGDTSVPVWSGVNIAGVRLRDLNPKVGTPEDPDKFNEMHKEVVNSCAEIFRLKQSNSCWAISASVSTIIRSIVSNGRNVVAVSMHSQGNHGITQDVYLSLPCILGENGVTHVIKQTLTEAEIAQLQSSAKTLSDVQAGITF